MSVAGIVESALHVARRTDRELGASARLAAALMLRQALEASIDDMWFAQAPEMRVANMRNQLIALRFYLDPIAARDARYAWYSLSDHCHVEGYERPPSLAEVEQLAEIIRRCSDAKVTKQL